MLRARVTVRLEQHQQPVVIAATRCFQRGPNFRGVMAVIVNQRDAVERSFDFETTPDARKFREARAD